MMLRLLFCISAIGLQTAVHAQIHSPIKTFTVSNGQSFGVSLSPDHKTAYFVNAYGGRQKLQIMQSENKNGKWSVPTPAFFNEPRTREIDPFVAPDGNTILYNSRRTPNLDDNKDFDVWMVKKTKGGWGNPIAVDAINTNENETYATMAANGNIYFGVNKQGGYGSGDIYVSKWENGKYQQPQNIGFPINTDGDEGNCFIAPDESYLIFSADSHAANVGGFDLYISFQINGQWTSPIHLGDEINTSDNDFSPTVFGKETLYFSRSKKQGDQLIEDIFYTQLNISFLRSLASAASTNVLDQLFTDGDVFGITFSPDTKTFYTTRSNEARTVCEVYSLQKNETDTFFNPQKVTAWSITSNVANPVISHDNTFALLRISGADKNPDLYISRKNVQGNWESPKALEGINTAVDEYYPELTADNHLYYSSNGDVFFAQYRDGQWQNPIPVAELNTSFSESNIAISRNGKFLVFLSNRPGCYGAYDLFICKKIDGGWSRPVNLGPKINTNAMEYQPRFSPDNADLYFTRSVFKDGKRQGKDVILKVSIEDICSSL